MRTKYKLSCTEACIDDTHKHILVAARGQPRIPNARERVAAHAAASDVGVQASTLGAALASIVCRSRVIGPPNGAMRNAFPTHPCLRNLALAIHIHMCKARAKRALPAQQQPGSCSLC
eukprot:scaffold107004_cov33-Tisochrysis_lutea.AAC.6